MSEFKPERSDAEDDGSEDENEEDLTNKVKPKTGKRVGGSRQDITRAHQSWPVPHNSQTPAEPPQAKIKATRYEYKLLNHELTL